jgi:glycosyltransferase involved in cell wall biosynthesis/LmbE family N-acetylglucosaminyl deacetylase
MLVEEKDLIPFATSKLPGGKWLVFAAHADDETFGMGGSLLLAKQQHISVTLVTLTDGQKTASVGANGDVIQTVNSKKQQAANSLVLENRICLGEKKRGLGISSELTSKIEKIIQTEKPDHIFIPSPMELHPDHRLSSEVVFQAINNVAIKVDVFCYEITVQSQINLLIDTSSVIDEKKSLLSKYKSQTALHTSLDIVLALDKARTYTLPAEVSYAEGFARLEVGNQGSLSEQLYKQLLPFWQTTQKGKLPLVSIIVRTKDRPELLKRAVQSILEQMYTNIELLIVNDGGSEVVIDETELKRCLTQFRLINLEHNVGRAGAANAGLKEFKGDFAMFLDDDDCIDSNHIINLIRIIQENNVEAAYSGVRTDSGQLFNHKYDKYHLYAGNYIPIHALVFSKKLIQQGCCFDEQFTVYEDWDFWLQMSQKTDFYHSDLVTATYFSSGNSNVGINADPSIDYNYRLKIYNKWVKIWTPELLNKILLSMHNRFQEKSSLLDESGRIQQQQQQTLQHNSAIIAALEQSIQQNQKTQSLSEFHTNNLEAKINALEIHIEALNGHISASQEHINASQKHINNLQEIIYYLENNGLVNRFQRVLSKLKQYLVKLVLNHPKLKFIAHFREYIRHHPKGLSRGFNILRKNGVKGFYMRLKQLVIGDFVNNPLVVKKNIHNINNTGYQYSVPILTPEIKLEICHFESTPLISIIMPVYNVEPQWLIKAIDSVNEQWYKNWELCIVDDASSNQDTLACLRDIKNKKIKIKLLKNNINISAASNKALTLTSGEYIALMDHDDELSPDALYEVVKKINDEAAEFIYSDEDKIDLEGNFCEPHFKADYSPDMIFSTNYMSHLGVIKKDLIDQVNGFTQGLEGAQDYDLYLKVLEKTENISHVSKVLYHWRKIPGSTASDFGHKSYAHAAGKQSIMHAIKRRSIDAQVLDGESPGTYRVKRAVLIKPLVSIIIPFKDKPELLKLCIESILKKSTYQNFQIIGISNNSSEKNTFEEMERLSSLDKRISFYEYNVAFNYSKINNYAVNNYAKGDYIILLNNDIEIITEDWIEELLSFAQRKDIGAVGAKLYYPNDSIQHAGVIVGINGVAAHSHKCYPRDSLGYFCRIQLIQNISAVTAACLMVSKAKYNEVNGLNEKNLKIAFNDVDFCLRLREKKYLNIYTPYCEAYHHESISRGAEDSPIKQQRFQEEIDYMKKIHSKALAKDPYYNDNLTLIREDFSLKNNT